MSTRTGALRRRRKRSLATRLRIVWVFLVIIAAAIGYAIYAFVTAPGLRARSVDVHVGGAPLTADAVLRAARVDPNANVWLLDTAQIARRVAALPYAGDVRVHRVPPAQLVIDADVRRPAACVRDGVRVVAVDETRRILQTGCPTVVGGAGADLPAITVRDGPLGAPGSIASASSLAALMIDGRELRAGGVAVRSLAQDRFGQLVAVRPDGVTLLFGGDADLAQKVKLVEPVLAATQRGRPVRALDLRAPATPIVDYR